EREGWIGPLFLFLIYWTHFFACNVNSFATEINSRTEKGKYSFLFQIIPNSKWTEASFNGIVAIVSLAILSLIWLGKSAIPNLASTISKMKSFCELSQTILG